MKGQQIAIVGKGGSGKTYGSKFLNPEETFYINCDKKVLTYKGSNKLYKDGINYSAECNIKKIVAIINNINTSDKAKHIKNIVIDTVNKIGTNIEFYNDSTLKLNEWYNFSKDIYSMIEPFQDTLRNDLFIFYIFHEIESNGQREILMNGKKLNKDRLLEGLFNHCFFIEVSKNEKNEIVRQLRVVNDGTCCAKSLEDCFETELIELNYQFIRDKIINW